MSGDEDACDVCGATIDALHGEVALVCPQCGALVTCEEDER